MMKAREEEKEQRGDASTPVVKKRNSIVELLGLGGSALAKANSAPTDNHRLPPVDGPKRSSMGVFKAKDPVAPLLSDLSPPLLVATSPPVGDGRSSDDFAQKRERKRSSFQQFSLEKQLASAGGKKELSSDLTLREKIEEVAKITGRRKSVVFGAVAIDGGETQSILDTAAEKNRDKMSLADGILAKDPFCYMELRANTGPKRGSTYYITSFNTTIGRTGGDATIQIPDSSLNYLHCSIKYEEGNFMLRDLKSRVGTYRFMRKDDSYYLEEGDVLICGETQLQVLAKPLIERGSCCIVM